MIASKASISVSVVILGILTVAQLNGAIWDPAADYSVNNNPSGTWSYGRKWTPEGTGFDSFTVKWGSGGWYLGNWGHGGPSIQGTPVDLWAKDNSNGLPALRWTCPQSGVYAFDIQFTGYDSRGVDVDVFTVINGTISFQDHIPANNFSVSFVQNQNLASGNVVDFVIKWTGGVYSEYSWTTVTGTIQTVPEPALTVILGLGAAIYLRRRKKGADPRPDGDRCVSP